VIFRRDSVSGMKPVQQAFLLFLMIVGDMVCASYRANQNTLLT
jgi:hypothetical protein